MPPPIPVELVPHSPQWAPAAQAEANRLVQAFGPNMIAVHHIGSTAIPDIPAKPILDLLPVVRSLGDLDGVTSIFNDLGYQCLG